MRGVLFMGPLGSGKVWSARRMAEALPMRLGEAAVETAWIHYGARLLEGPPELAMPAPFRAPHHTVSTYGLIGSPVKDGMRPGEVSLAHGGCLLLDELVEFRKDAVRELGRVLKEGKSGFLPARPALVCATATPPDEMSRFLRWAERVMEYGELLGLTEIVQCNSLRQVA